MECNLIQELIDAHNIMDQTNDLNDVIMSQGDHNYTLKDWFRQHPQVLRQLKLTPDELTYQLINSRLNQAMADLF